MYFIQLIIFYTHNKISIMTKIRNLNWIQGVANQFKQKILNI